MIGKKLLELKREIISAENNDVVRKVYRWKINEKLASLRMLRASLDGDDSRFLRYSQFIYGSPDRRIYENTISEIRRTVDKKLFSNDPDVSLPAGRINKEIFGALMESVNDIGSPSEFGMPGQKSLKGEREYSLEEIEAAFEKALFDMDAGNWKVVLDANATAINTNQEKKVIEIPLSRKMKESKLAAIIKHEAGIHALRRESGERSKLMILGLGLDRYIKGEEGVSTSREQQILGGSDFAGLGYHFAISLALGIDEKKRSFREVFEILKDYYLISSKKNKEEALKSAEDSAWSSCVRIFRGTTCKTPGACLTRDLVYREGNIGIWNVIRNNPEESRRFSVGKYDPNNPRHIWILEQLGITDDDLESLEK